MKTPTIDYIMEVSDITTQFAVELAKLCEKYGRDIEKEMYKACLILSDDLTLRVLRGK